MQCNELLVVRLYSRSHQNLAENCRNTYTDIFSATQRKEGKPYLPTSSKMLGHKSKTQILRRPNVIADELKGKSLGEKKICGAVLQQIQVTS
jgi:hypothetical protein